VFPFATAEMCLSSARIKSSPVVSLPDATCATVHFRSPYSMPTTRDTLSTSPIGFRVYTFRSSINNKCVIGWSR